MRACREGGEAIEAALVGLDRAHFASLYRECRRAIGDHDAAQDLVQETFIRVWRRCATFRGESELYPWVRSILRHAILDRLKQPEREVPMPDDPELDAALPRAAPPAAAASAVATPDREAERREREASFARGWRRFAEAAPQHAAVLAWIVEDGLDNEQVAALLGRTPGATREFISQCRKRARVHLQEWYALTARRESA